MTRRLTHEAVAATERGMRLTSLGVLAVLGLSLPLAAACSSEEDEAPHPASEDEPDASSRRDSSASTDDDDRGATPSGCHAAPKDADRTRKVVVSHPFDADGKKAKLYEVLELSSAGELARTTETFSMGVGFTEIVFTPDGQVGFVAQDDGSIGAFTFDDAGKVRVTHQAFTGKFSAGRLVVSRDGARLFVIDPNTKENGGGVHEVKIACDGALSYVGLAVPGGKAHAMALLPNAPDEAVLVAGAAFDSAASDYVHRLDLSSATPTRIASGAAFDDSEAIASSVSITPDGKWALVTDNGILKGNRMAPIALDTMKKGTSIDVANPAMVAMSPFGNAALLLDSDGEDALRVVSYDPTKTEAPFSVGAEVAYKDGKKTALPTIANVIDRGGLKGRVLVSENLAIRQLTFAAAGTISDLGVFTFGEDFTEIVGSMGVQP